MNTPAYSPLSGQTVLITGASAGIGAACAELFSSAGARIVLTGRRQERLEELAARLPGPSQILLFDVRQRREVEDSLARLTPPFSEVDILINNAGLGLGLEPAHQASIEDWEMMIDTNCKGLLYVTRALLPGMVARNRGHIVNLGSVSANYAYPGGNVYGGTKAFVHQFSQNLKTDLLGTQVRVTNIEPGMVETEFSVVRFKGDAARAQSVYAGMKPLTGHDIADIILWTVTRPAHVNINVLEVMPVDQAFGPFAVKRR